MRVEEARRLLDMIYGPTLGYADTVEYLQKFDDPVDRAHQLACIHTQLGQAMAAVARWLRGGCRVCGCGEPLEWTNQGFCDGCEKERQDAMWDAAEEDKARREYEERDH
jgi:CDGSH-type Zn-finger protein